MTHLEVWLQTPLAAAIGWTLFHSLWEGVIVAVALAVTLALTRSAPARYASACLAMCAIILCFGVTLLELMPRHQTPVAARNSIALGGSSRVDLPDIAQAPMRRVADFLPWLVPFWMAGVVLFYLRHLASWAMARRLRQRGVCAAPDFWQERMRVLAGRLRLSRQVRLLESCLARVPVVIGHLRPVILMPVGLLTGLPAAQIESILLHELAHIRRYDYLVNMLQTLVEGLLFYHPVVWWISGVIRTEREHCCDDVAVTLSGDAHEYARALATLEQSRWDATETALAATGGNLVKRIRRLLIPSEGPGSSLSGSALTPFVSAGILMITLAVALTAWQEKVPASPAPVPEQGFFAQNPTAQAELGQDTLRRLQEQLDRLVGQVPATPRLDSLIQRLHRIEAYTKWLEEDVTYIIQPEEREAFLHLESDEERAEFIQQFWQRRDPTPGTPENEFKDEHYRRIAYANLHFPTATGKAGWKTDRGRIYIRFGPPDEIDDHSAIEAPAVPYLDWTYRWIEGVGTNVTMEFVDPARTHDFNMTLDPNPPAK